MKLSQLIERLNADLAAHGDTEYVALCLAVTGTDGKKRRLDAYIGESGEVDILRDANVVSGLCCITADYQGPIEVFV